VAPSPELAGPKDPFDESKQLALSADIILGQAGNLPGQFQRPHDLAVAPDGSLYIADTENNRIQHLDRSGEVLNIWGSFGDVVSGNAPGGTFNQPWGIGIGPDGSVYVADTWNHRIQKFGPDGAFLYMWGYFGQAEQPDAFWGPRDVVVDNLGRVFVADTGNKRIVVFDADGKFITQFGSAGLGPGQFDEPVGITIDAKGQVFVADTWNQRIQVFAEDSLGEFKPVRSWDLVAWFGQSLDNKPYLAADGNGNVFTVEPEGYRVLWFDEMGQALHYWGDFGTTPDRFGMPASIAIDPLGGVWVSDAGNNRIMHFTLPE
jgi:DNA-binding beta-propeller fold protein YncE